MMHDSASTGTPRLSLARDLNGSGMIMATTTAVASTNTSTRVIVQSLLASLETDSWEENLSNQNGLGTYDGISPTAGVFGATLTWNLTGSTGSGEGRKEQRRGEGGAGTKASTAIVGNEEYGGRHTSVGPGSDTLIRPIEEPIWPLPPLPSPLDDEGQEDVICNELNLSSESGIIGQSFEVSGWRQVGWLRIGRKSCCPQLFELIARPFDIIGRKAFRNLAPTMSSVTADSPDTLDNATTVQNDQTDGSAMTVANVDVPGPLASGGTSATTVTQEEDAQALRNVSPGTRTSITVAQSMQMFNGSSQIEFTDSVFSNVGGNKNETVTHNVYHIYGNPNIYCSPTDLGALHINSVGSSGVLGGAASSRPEHVNHGDMDTLATSTENGSANSIQTDIPTPLAVQGRSNACEDQASCSGPRAQGKENQQATPAADGDQTSKSG
ncbi:hypothetical protein K435DRAFT_858333 [Dendrothele bispora CBS 962.96]|uniref:Uncharacterized protein n=1 Tax=Dendrothele bispora (strain CBS 962.96) TaxID=1314807 RepID=A0A4S8M396_DENBC|nr:hypothetical protein K435DRAFT_858333 [Dendrothele bispora CBS 962.96]